MKLFGKEDVNTIKKKANDIEKETQDIREEVNDIEKETQNIKKNVYDIERDLQDVENVDRVAAEHMMEQQELIPEQQENSEDESEEKKEVGTDFSDFLKHFMDRVVSWFKVHQKTILSALGVCATACIVVLLISFISKQIDAAKLAASLSDNNVVDLTNTGGMIPVPLEPLQVDAYPAVNDIIRRYYDALQTNDIEALSSIRNYMDSVEVAKVNVKYEYIEWYDNIICYTKAGPIENSYVVYAYYNLKLRDWDIVVPGLMTFLVCTRENGELYIYDGYLDQNITNYIYALSSQQDVLDLWSRVDTEYHEILDGNPELTSYIDSLNQFIKDGIGARLAEDNYFDSTPEQEQPENDVAVSENEITEPEEPTTFEVKASTTVNVRASDSEQADRIGRVTAGTVLICNGHQANGWSEVIYEGEIGYIMTRYLINVGDVVDESLANGTVTVNETVNIRAEADIDADKVGVAYAGESFPLIGSTDGEWCQIIYNGQYAYIKTEFIDD